MRSKIRPRPALRGALAIGAAALLAVGLTGCSEDKDTVASWSTQGGREHIRVIGDDIRTLIQFSGQAAGSAPRCQQVLDHVKSATAYRPLPDEIARERWEKALDQVKTAATTCIQNTDSFSGGPTLSEAAAAQSAFGQLADRISQLAKSKS
ncbi:hypothetical protein OHV05_34315 [Kitasatospora sp. NBC_00070]|uniref:hypothetical protein n=1 Tax=Kitasatospora sp. NBC_00070 TaxID=2975962 RepID=UPI003246E102